MTEDYFSRILYSVSPSVLRKWTLAKLSVQLYSGRCGGQRKSWQPVSGAASVVSFKRASNQWDHTTSRLCLAQMQAFFCLLRMLVFISCLHSLRSWSEAPSLQPTCNTTPAQPIFPTLHQDAITAFLWRSLAALSAFGPWEAFILPHSKDGKAKSPIFCWWLNTTFWYCINNFDTCYMSYRHLYQLQPLFEAILSV